ncbi:hypothetical protein MKW92_040645 [Papaver armeniacum]|nr:hypothetical protein MKW92_040645 [Papaver armeniacum]
MEDEKDVKGTSTREWEVVTLTASTYAAAPGPESLESSDGNQMDVNDDEETSRAMFMSGHFVFPPSQHENLPLLGSDKNDEENWNARRMAGSDELHGIQFFDESGKRLSVRPSEFEEERSLLGLDLNDKEQILSNQDSSSDSTSPTYVNKFNESGLPCEAWWKRRAASLIAQAKDANAIWSVVVAATLMGLHVKWQTIVGDEDVRPHISIKDVFVSSHGSGNLIKVVRNDI